jgi:ribosomal protein S18 acetylase RimI-like enzyme
MSQTNSMYYIEVPEFLTPEQQQMLIELEKDAFPGLGAVDEQTLVPLARYGKILLCRQHDDDRPVAVCECMRDYNQPDKAYIFGYYVRSDQHGKGLGTKFLHEVLNILKADGFQKVSLTVSEANTAAVKLYKNLGFMVKEFRYGEFGAGEDRLYMEISL